mmetsp:Transcript_11682/g.25639  ORF Transcript_11682/g.25639 Transcript_11682/m.25639 type:complete len:83 (-) Transcript_11682:264-512(-)
MQYIYIYIDMRQVEQAKEAGFFLNSFFTMDLKTLQLTAESQIGYKAGLRYKAIIGASRPKDGQKAVQAIHVNVDTNCFHKTL